MKNTAEIDKQLKEVNKQLSELHTQIRELYAQAQILGTSKECLKRERKAAAEEELKAYIDNWLFETFGITDQKEARGKVYIVFDKEGNFIKTVTWGHGTEFQYVGPAKDKGTLEYWLKKNRLYAHAAASFCDRNYSWYQMSLREQLKNLCWEFDKSGKICKAQW